MKYIKFLAVLIALGVITGFYLYNKPVRSTSSKPTDISIRSEELLKEFELNETVANQKYLDKVVSVTGIIKTIEVEDSINVITLNTNSPMAGIVCKMEHKAVLPAGIKPGDAIGIKGVCTGMLMDVIIIRCVTE